jgi:hypothetical protein
MLERIQSSILVPATLLALTVLFGCDSMPTTYDQCSNDTSCTAAGEHCIDGLCQTPCTIAVDCAGGQDCDNGACGSFCTQSSDCGTGSFCEGAHCVHGCMDDSNCGAGRTCGPNSYCSGCGKDAECAAGQTCNGGSCTCVADADCFAGEACTSGVCRATPGHADPRVARRSLPVTRVLQLMFGYASPPSVTFEVVDPTPGASSVQRLTFDTAAGNLETFTTAVTYPQEFDFAGFTALGPANTQIGSFALDVDRDGVPDAVVPLRALAVNHAYADQARTAQSVALDATIGHAGAGGPHVFTIEIPRGGDADLKTLGDATSVRVVVTLFAGILRNPSHAGAYVAHASFTSVDPDTDGPDDGTGESPEKFSFDLPITIATTTTLPTECVRTVTFESVICRLGALRTLVVANVPAGPLQTHLLATITQAQGKAGQAEMLRTQGKKRPARSAVGRTIAALGSFKHRLKARAARGLGSLRATLLADAADLVKDLRALRHQ